MNVFNYLFLYFSLCRKKETSPLTVTTSSSPESQGTPPSIMSNHSPNSPSSNKDAWPSLQPGSKPNNKPTRTDQHNKLNNKIRTKSEEDTDHRYTYNKKYFIL